ncbi:MAG: GNAT family N-acetyltransferase [Planctomycetota bacterium]|nr:GNAT family N-acetyltransferase [Planctomycetota bacterium]
MDVRRAEESDHSRIGELIAEGYPEENKVDPGVSDASGETASWFGQQVARLLVAELDERLIGVVAYDERAEGCEWFPAGRAGRQTAAIRLLAVCKEHRCQGIGSRLVRECLRRAKAAGRTELVIHTPREVTPGFLTSIGFRRCPEQDGFDKSVCRYAQGRLLASHGGPPLIRSIESRLSKTDGGMAALTLENLAPWDHLHSRGWLATAELAERFPPPAGARVLDAGCGLGGTARYLAQRYSVHVDGIDSNRQWIECGNYLSERVGLERQVQLMTQDATRLNVPTPLYDAVWSQHLQMNIQNKAHLLKTIRNALCPGGTFVFHEVFSGKGGFPRFPLPWAGLAGESCLVSLNQYRFLLESAGFDKPCTENVTRKTLADLEVAVQKMDAAAREPPQACLVSDWRTRVINYLDALRRGTVEVVVGGSRIAEPEDRPSG